MMKHGKILFFMEAKMKKYFWLIAIALVLAITGCKKQQETGPQVITFWYNNTGDEAKVYEQAIAEYNASQSKYRVEGLSVNDTQKLIVALASREAPDLVKGSNYQVTSYQVQGFLESMKSYIDRDKFDVSTFAAKSIEANTMKGEIFGLPLSGYTIQMFYNKDLLAAAGYSAPPANVEEMYEMAVKATKLDANGNIDVLGYPLFPFASARQELIYAFGGRWWAEDLVTLTPQNPGVLESLRYNVRYRTQYGIDKVQAFIATANTNRYTEQDMFFAGKQLFRLDGSWLPTMMENFKSTVNWGIAYIPSLRSNPSSYGTSRYETDSVFIPVTAANKDGAWDFAKWITGLTGSKIILLGTGNLPALKALYTDRDILAKPGFKEFIDALQLEKGIQYPTIGSFAEYTSMINEVLDNVYSGNQTPESAMATLADRAKNLK
jgi:multiple sugar transport system substrate-binding protein